MSTFVGLGALLGFLSVAFGAFGAHVLSGRLSADKMNVFHTAVQYQMYHALALVLVALLISKYPSPWLSAAGWCFVAGIVLFSGSLYGLTFTSLSFFGPITPLGGLCFLAGWIFLVVFAWVSAV